VSTTTYPPPIEPGPPPAAAPDRPDWRAWTAPAALLGAFLGAFVLGLPVFVINVMATGHSHITPAANVAATVLGDVAFICSALFFAQLAAFPRPEQFGLRPTRLWPAVGWAALGYAAFWTFSTIWLALLDQSSKDHTLDDLGHGTAALAAAAILVTVIAPMAEEFLFRGYIFTALRGWVGVLGSALITGLLFGAIHFDSSRPDAFLLPLAFFGFVLCLIYWKTGSLYPCIALHSINNALAFGVTEGWSWQIPLLAVGALSVITLILLQVRRLAATWAPVAT
jgi:membrane protease YdiL (CAAX protease family)